MPCEADAGRDADRQRFASPSPPGDVNRYRYAALFVLLSAVWGTAFVVTKVGLRTTPPALLAALRFDLATVLLFGYVALRGCGGGRAVPTGTRS
jgi:drug/metabolite transporter (DMT)-like permease